MDHHERFRRAAIGRGIPEEEVGRFAEFLRFEIRTSRSPTGGVVGQHGGLPALPVGMEWPSAEFGPLPFIASFDCAALPRVPGLALPVDGSLLFFLDREFAFDAGTANGSVADEQEFARVVHVPAGTATVPVEAPAGSDAVTPEHDLFATVAADLPVWFDGREPESTRTDNGEHLARDLRHLDQLCAVATELWPQNTWPDVYLGGYTGSGASITGYMDETPETEMAVDNLEARQKAGDIVILEGEWELRLEEEALRVMREWVPLAQFATVDAYWGCFMIRHEDLAARRFDKALSRTQFTE
ncbi:DUF1963 domain-containing protein [Actinoplanes sp. NPDC023936]|uniref:DUF1963 domain-containing protein n=1 Tax=Actinoplanes sp. NPDC023936 TaxID=3154910 RepID=UPI0033DEB563